MKIEIGDCFLLKESWGEHKAGDLLEVQTKKIYGPKTSLVEFYNHSIGGDNKYRLYVDGIDEHKDENLYIEPTKFNHKLCYIRNNEYVPLGRIQAEPHYFSLGRKEYKPKKTRNHQLTDIFSDLPKEELKQEDKIKIEPQKENNKNNFLSSFYKEYINING